MIALVTTCRGRLAHLKETLPRNLADTADFPDAKFIVLNYNDHDGLMEYLHTAHAQDIASGRLVVYSYRDRDRFHVAHAKNMAMRCAILEGADILITLDADNFTGPHFAQFVADKLRERGSWPGVFLCPDFPLIHSLPHGPDRPARGYAGRLAIWAQDFIKAGGYDEVFDVWGGEDMDMIFRLQRMGYSMRHIGNGHLNAIPHNAAVRFREYPEAKQYETKRYTAQIAARTETVVNRGRWGMGTVWRNSAHEPIEIGAMPTRIFGIGMHKTGTTSLHHAFQILGMDSFHWGEGQAPLIWQEMAALGRSRTLEQYYALSDLPIPLLYKELDQAYPGSKFILTIRDERAWLRSVRRLWDPKYNPTRWVWDVYPFSNHIHTVLYGQKDFDEDVFIRRYRRHNAEVLEYFRDRPDDLLVLDIGTGAKQEWEMLCNFLGRPVPAVPFPCKNTSDKNHARLSAFTTGGDDEK